MKPPERLLTVRLVLRKPLREDAPRIFGAYAQDASVTQYLLWRPHRNISETYAYLELCLRNWEGDHDFAWVIESRNSGELMGMIGMRIEATSANVGYVLAVRFWNQGFMSEAVKGLTDWALGQETVFRVWAVCDTGNTASARVLEKAGMQCEGTLRRWVVLPNMGNEPRDCFCFSRVKS